MWENLLVMHIRETEDERLDYAAFYDFPDGENVTEAAGRRTWELLHGLADHYPCPPCKGPFQVLMSGIHDVVNVHLEKPVHNPEQFEAFLTMVDEAKEKARVRTHEHTAHKHVLVE